MLHIASLEAISALLLKVPELVDRLEKNDATFHEGVAQWLAGVEKALVECRLPVAGRIASLRSAVLVSRRGVLTSGVVHHGRPTLRRVREAAAADALRIGNELISKALEADQARIQEGVRLLRQVVFVAAARGLPLVPSPDVDRREALAAVWRTLLSTEELRQGALSVESLLGRVDVLVALDQAIATAQ